VSDHEDEAPRRRKKVITRSYKEPPKPSAKKPASPKKKVIKSPKKSPEKRSSSTPVKSLRKSTAAKSAATQHRLKARHEAERMKPKQVKNDDPLPTQEELLEEAEKTEKENLLSLEKFRKMELEKKKVRPTKGTTYTGPIIRYHSMSMPVIQDEQKPKEIIDEHDEKKRTTRRSRMAASDAAKAAEKHRCERTFITFENDINNKVFESVFPPPAKRPRRDQLCAVTKLPAKYFDPVTQLPYHNTMAFKIIRETYYQMLETKGDQSDIETAAWLAWRKKSKETKKTIKAEP
jgi:vacuolar protein sorting-associated protein 72